jgi:hypothetical protein
MRLDLILGVPLALATTSLIFWGAQWRQSRKAGVAAMCAALIFLDVALLVGIFYWPINTVTRLPALPQLLQHTAVLTSAFWLQMFCLHLRYAEEAVATKARSRVRLLGFALLGLLIFWVLGPLASGLPAVSAEYGYPPLVQCYVLIYVTYLSLAMGDIYLSSRQARHIPRRWLRLGLRLLGAGSLFGLVYGVWRLVYGVSGALNLELPWTDTGTNGISTYAAFLAICLMTLGVLVPPIGTRWDATKATRKLRPLWTAMTFAAPELVFPERQGTRLRAYVTEIRDVLIGPLKPYLDADVAQRARQLAEQAGLVDDLESIVEAAVIAVALKAHHHRCAPRHDSPIAIAIPDDADESADVDRLVRIATAFATSAIVTTVVEEFIDRDPAH